MFLIDSHCHINSDQLRADAASVVRRAASAGVGRILTVGCSLSDSAEAVEMANLYESDGVYATVGVHPHEAKTAADGLPRELLDLAKSPRVAAIGETGLDYHYDHSPRDVQRDVFNMHVDWALKAEKPLVIHVRNAEGDTRAMDDALSILEKFETRPKLMFHCYAGGLGCLDAVKKLDAYISIGGPVTWPKGDELRAVSSSAPKDRLLCETDAPWLTPKPYRGKLNEPAYVRFVYDAVANARGMDAEELARAVDENAARFFGWKALYV